MSRSTRNAQIRENIRNILAAQTALDADHASVEGIGDSFLFDTSGEVSERLNGPLTRVWRECSARYGDPSRPWPQAELDRFKAALVTRLELTLAPEPDWDATQTLEQIGRKARDADFGNDDETLLAMPASLLDRCWARLQECPGDPGATQALLHRYCVGAKKGETDDLCQLKRLLDTFRAGPSDLAARVGTQMRSYLGRRLSAGMKKAGISTEDLRENPMAAAEEALAGDSDGPAGRLLAGLVQAGYRGVAASDAQTLFYAIMLGLREAYNFYLAARLDLAKGSISWAESQITPHAGEFTKEHRNVLGQLYASAASGARESQYFDNQRALLTTACQLLESGDEYAECLYWLGVDEARQGRPAEAFKLYRQGLEVKDLRDPGTRTALEGAASILESEWRGDPSKFKMGEPGLSAFGFRTDFLPAMQGVLQDMLAGRAVSAERLREAVTALRETIQHFRTTDQSADRLLQMYVLLMGIGLSGDGVSMPDLPDLAAEAAGYTSGAAPGLVLQYRQMAAAVRDRYGKAAGPAQDPAHVMDQIVSLPNSHERLTTLHTLVASVLDGATTGFATFPLLRAMQVAADALAADLATAPTAEAAALYRAGAEELARYLAILVFMRCGWEPSQGGQGNFFNRHVARASDSELVGLLDAYARLLEVSAGVMLRHFMTEPFAVALQRLPSDDRERFRARSEEITVVFAQDIAGLLAPDDRQLCEAVEELRQLRALAQAAAWRARDAASPNRVERPGAAELYVVELGTASASRVSGFARSSTHYHLWTGPPWTDFHQQFAALTERPLNGPTWDAFHAAYASRTEMRLSTVLDGGCHVTSVACRNLTRTEASLAWVGDSDTSYTLTIGCDEPVAAATDRHVSFWGRMAYRQTPPLTYDDAGRIIHVTRPSERTVAFPQPAAAGEFDGVRSQLPYAAYELWTLEDICRASGRRLTACIDGGPTRDAFLSATWDAATALHVSTHGEASSSPELARLWFAVDGGRRSFVTFTDILARDWSRFEVVFLNACLTTSGRHSSGEVPLSMAWAFKAGGAKAVIANRWEVGDVVAWLFGKCFYESFLTDSRATVEDAFQTALRTVKRHPLCHRPHQWGTFCLLR